MNELAAILGRYRYEELLRDAQASRLSGRVARTEGNDRRRTRLRGRIGRALVLIGQALAGPDTIQPA